MPAPYWTTRLLPTCTQDHHVQHNNPQLKLLRLHLGLLEPQVQDGMNKVEKKPLFNRNKRADVASKMNIKTQGRGMRLQLMM